MIDTKKTEQELRTLIDTLLLDMTIDEQNKLENLCNGSNAELNDAHKSYNDETASYRPNNDGLRKYLDAISAIRKIS